MVMLICIVSSIRWSMSLHKETRIQNFNYRYALYAFYALYEFYAFYVLYAVFLSAIVTHM